MLIQKRLFDRPIFDMAHAHIANERTMKSHTLDVPTSYSRRANVIQPYELSEICKNSPFLCMSCIASLKWINSLQCTAPYNEHHIPDTQSNWRSVKPKRKRYLFVSFACCVCALNLFSRCSSHGNVSCVRWMIWSQICTTRRASVSEQHTCRTFKQLKVNTPK